MEEMFSRLRICKLSQRSVYLTLSFLSLNSLVTINTVDTNLHTWCYYLHHALSTL